MTTPLLTRFYGKDITPSDSPEYEGVTRMPFEDWLAWDHGPRITEWVNGEVFIYMSVSDPHDRIVQFLRTLLGGWAELTNAGVVRGGPYAMQAETGGPGREPDVFVVLRQHADRITQSHLVGPPDLAIEIVSDDSPRRDRIVKFAEYSAAGISEYWIIDPRQGRERADFFSLQADDATYESMPVVAGVVHSVVLEGFWLRTEWLWEAEPRPIAALREVMGGRVL